MQLPLCSSRLAANTTGLAFAVAVSVVARYIQHDFGLGWGLRITKNPGKKNLLVYQTSRFSKVSRSVLVPSPRLKNSVHLFKLTPVARYIWHGK